MKSNVFFASATLAGLIAITTTFDLSAQPNGLTSEEGQSVQKETVGQGSRDEELDKLMKEQKHLSDQIVKGVRQEIVWQADETVRIEIQELMKKKAQYERQLKENKQVAELLQFIAQTNSELLDLHQKELERRERVKKDPKAIKAEIAKLEDLKDLFTIPANQLREKLTEKHGENWTLTSKVRTDPNFIQLRRRLKDLSRMERRIEEWKKILNGDQEESAQDGSKGETGTRGPAGLRGVETPDLRTSSTNLRDRSLARGTVMVSGRGIARRRTFRSVTREEGSVRGSAIGSELYSKSISNQDHVDAMIKVSPNPAPAGETLRIEHVQGLVEVFTIRGQKVWSAVANNGQAIIPAGTLSSGMSYFARSEAGTAKFTVH